MFKYLSVFRTSFRQESKAKWNMVITAINFLVIAYVLYMLWNYIYTNGQGELIEGYTLEMMIWYLIMSEVLAYSFNARRVTISFSSQIKSGAIAYQLNKPYNYYFYQISTNFATFAMRAIFILPAGIIMGLICVGGIANFSAAYVFPILLSYILGFMTNLTMYAIIGLLAFWVEESTPFTWIIQKFVIVLGTFFPPEFFPSWLQPFITYSPIYAMMSGPAKLLANFSWQDFLQVSVTQVAYIAIFIGIAMILYKFGTRKVNVNGG